VPTLTTCLFFNRDAVEAAEFYASVLPDTSILSIATTQADTPFMKAGEVLSVSLKIMGQPFVGINGGPDFPFTEAISLQVLCADQAEVDHYWEKLVEGGGEYSQCGWLKDRFGLSWQVIPREMTDYLEGPDPAGCARAMEAMLKMSKLDIDELHRAYYAGTFAHR
jgi:predicted 3-demethylubiquinone-9 3-methyltransferase (glyoxalase superfamily)